MEPDNQEHIDQPERASKPKEQAKDPLPVDFDLSSIPMPQGDKIAHSKKSYVAPATNAEAKLLSDPLASPTNGAERAKLWNGYGETIQGIVKRMGRLTHTHSSIAAGYRTFCLPELVKGLKKSGKMEKQPAKRFWETYEFLETMITRPIDAPETKKQLMRVGGLHRRYGVAQGQTEEEREFFKYIALNMFVIGFQPQPDLTPKERQAICGITKLVSEEMGVGFDGSTLDLEKFINDYEAREMFDPTNTTPLRNRAIAIAAASEEELGKSWNGNRLLVREFLPERVRDILQIEDLGASDGTTEWTQLQLLKLADKYLPGFIKKPFGM